jgi:hypothetical protein
MRSFSEYAKHILIGGDDAATQYFKHVTYTTEVVTNMSCPHRMRLSTMLGAVGARSEQGGHGIDHRRSSFIFSKE